MITAPIATPIAVIAIFSGVLTFLMSTRIVQSIDRPDNTSTLAQSLLVRWMYLFFIEIVACSFIYFGASTLHLLPALSLLLAVSIIIATAFLISCMLVTYL